MKSLNMAFLIFGLLAFTGCPKTTTPATVLQSVVAAAQGAICPLAQEFADEAGAKVAAMTGNTNALACGAALYQPLINANICNTPIPAPVAAAALKAGHADATQWKTLGDIPATALKGADGKLLKTALKNEGVIVSGLLCPAGVGILMGVASAAIPPACQGPNSLNSSDLDAALVNVCQLVTASLP